MFLLPETSRRDVKIVTNHVSLQTIKLYKHVKKNIFFYLCSHQSVGDGCLDVGAGVEDSHGVDGGRDPSLMGQTVCRRKRETWISRWRGRRYHE